MKARRLWIVLGILILLGPGCSRPSIRSDSYPSRAKDQYTRIKRVAVVPYENYSEGKDADKAVDVLLVPAVRREEVFEEVEDVRFVRDVMKKLKITSTDVLDKEVVKKLGDEMNVQGILMGKLIGYGAKEKGVAPQVTMDLILMEPSTGSVLWVGNVIARGSLTWDEVFGWGTGYLPIDVARDAVGKLVSRMADDIEDRREEEKKGLITEIRSELSKEQEKLKQLQAQTGATQAEIDKAKAEAQGIRDTAKTEAEAIRSDLELQKAALEAEKSKTDQAQQQIDQEKLKVEMEQKKIQEDLQRIEDEKKRLEDLKKDAEEAQKKAAEVVREEPVQEPSLPASAPAEPAPASEAPPADLPKE